MTVALTRRRTSSRNEGPGATILAWLANKAVKLTSADVGVGTSVPTPPGTRSQLTAVLSRPEHLA